MKSEYRLEPNANVFNALIAVCTRNAQMDKALQLFEEMKRLNIAPLKQSFLNVAYACVSNFHSQYHHTCTSHLLTFFRKAIDIIKGMETKLGMKLEMFEYTSLFTFTLRADDLVVTKFVFDKLR